MAGGRSKPPPDGNRGGSNGILRQRPCRALARRPRPLRLRPRGRVSFRSAWCLARTRSPASQDPRRRGAAPALAELGCGGRRGQGHLARQRRLHRQRQGARLALNRTMSSHVMVTLRVQLRRSRGVVQRGAARLALMQVGRATTTPARRAGSVSGAEGREGGGERDRRQAQRHGRPQAPHHGHGLTRAPHVYVKKVARSVTPIELTVRGYELSIRRDLRQRRGPPTSGLASRSGPARFASPVLRASELHLSNYWDPRGGI